VCTPSAEEVGHSCPWHWVRISEPIFGAVNPSSVSPIDQNKLGH